MSAKRPRQRAPRPARRKAASDRAPIVIVPKQTSAVIAERNRIREEFHDSKATTIKGRRR